MRKIIFDGSCYDYLMRVNGFSCGLNTPPALSGDSTFGLPPYCKRMPYLVDKYPACPSDWMRSEGKIKSYFVPVLEGNGMWLDFNENETKPNHVAVVISVQGINPITGLPCKDAQLEQYIEECPKHKIKFGPDRYCKKCDYKWPKQNYLSTTGTPHGMFWLDGFRSIDGIVRQYVLTSDKMRGVAGKIIGKDRVFAIGLSFFTSKEKKICHSNSETRGIIYYGQPNFWSPLHNPINWQIPTTTKDTGEELTSGDNGGWKDYNNNIYATSASCDPSSLSNKYLSFATTNNTMAENKSSKRKPKTTGGKYEKDVWSKASIVSRRGAVPVVTKQLEVSAGAKISQSVYDDPEKLEFWHNDSEGIICVNYCSENECKKIVEQGEISLDGHPEGFLKEIPVGN